jgi:hypothetical protein
MMNVVMVSVAAPCRLLSVIFVVLVFSMSSHMAASILGHVIDIQEFIDC